jgi:hypothetical protein
MQCVEHAGQVTRIKKSSDVRSGIGHFHSSFKMYIRGFYDLLKTQPVVEMVLYLNHLPHDMVHVLQLAVLEWDAMLPLEAALYH